MLRNNFKLLSRERNKQVPIWPNNATFLAWLVSIGKSLFTEDQMASLPSKSANCLHYHRHNFTDAFAQLSVLSWQWKKKDFTKHTEENNLTQRQKEGEKTCGHFTCAFYQLLRMGKISSEVQNLIKQPIPISNQNSSDSYKKLLSS